MPNWIFTLAGGALLGLIGWLLKRAIDAIDKKMDATCTKVDTACVAVNDMRLEMSGYKQLVQYLHTDVLALKSENHSLRESHHVIDKYIAVQQALQQKKST
jgi:hypothetical protein